MRCHIAATLLLILAFTVQAGGIYKCQVDGRTVYQQVACPEAANSARVRIVETPPSSRTGGLRASEVRALRGILQEQRTRTAQADDNTDALTRQDARFISTFHQRYEEHSEGGNRRETESAEASLKQVLERYNLDMDQVRPQLEGETMIDRVQDEIAIRAASPEAVAQYREQRRHLLAVQEAEEQAREAERRARQAEMAAQAAQAQQAQQPVPTSDGGWLYPNDPAGNTFHGSDGGHYIRQGNMIVNPHTGQTYLGN